MLNYQNPVDPGYQETEEELARLEAELHDLYEAAAIEAQETALNYMEHFLDASEKMLERVQAGIITIEDYQRWQMTHILTAERFQRMANVIASDLLNVKLIAASIINGYIPDVYAINMNYETYSIESKTGISTSFTLYNRQAVERLVREHPDLLPFTQVDEKKVVRWDKQHINSAVAQGIMQGDSVPELAARMRMVTDMDERASIRSARTAITSAQNGGRMDAMRRVQDMGATVRKQWIATLDYRTRSAHRHLDGKVAKLDEAFASDLGDIRYPGDPKAKPGNVYNCRCCLVNYDPMFPFNASDISQRYSKRLEGMSYEEWKNAQPEYGKSNSSNRGYAINPDNPSYGYSGRNGLTSAQNSGNIVAESNTFDIAEFISDESIIDKESAFKELIRNGSVNTDVDWPNQNNHVSGAVWRNIVKQAVMEGKGKPKSILSGSVDIEEIVKKYAGTGKFEFNEKGGTISEFITLPEIIGRTFEIKIGKYVPSYRIQIKYGKKGVHIFPTKEKGG